MVPADAKSPALAMEQSSAQDFATAEKYLKGARGSSRDSREASQWLWKAVSKGNPAATVALSDLYLRGDGVPKNCDQARLLLDAAARKGVKGAADRLRNLQAFGCR
jgi:TPR repeat protein